MAPTIGPVTDVVISRKLWQEWSAYWPAAGADDPLSYVSALREQEGGGISVAGGVDTIRSLFMAGPVDALTLTMHPAVTNEGRRLFDERVPLTRLRLVDSTITSAGNAILTYALRG